MLRQLQLGFCGVLLFAAGAPLALAAAGVFPREVMLQIVRAEDLRRWDGLGPLLAHGNPLVRERAALAAGRIGDAGAVAALEGLLESDPDPAVRATAAFGLGEIGAGGIGALGKAAADAKAPPLVRARAVEAVGKLAAPLPEGEAGNRQKLGGSILTILEVEAARPAPAREVVLLGITAALRAKGEGTGVRVAGFLSSPDAEIRATAANTLARLRSTEGLARARVLAVNDTSPEVRANAMRMLGAASEPAVFDLLGSRLAADSDARVRVSAIRALAAMGGPRAAEPLLQRGVALATAYRADGRRPTSLPAETGEILEIAAALGTILGNTGHEGAVGWLRSLDDLPVAQPEIDSAFARIAPGPYLRHRGLDATPPAAIRVGIESRIAGLAALAEFPEAATAIAGGGNVREVAQAQLRSLLERSTGAPQRGAALEALAAFKPADLDELLRRELAHEAEFVRETAAGLLEDRPPSEENARVLALWKASRPGALGSRNTDADYDRAIARIGRSIRAVVDTEKGSFAIELFPDEATLTVDNFVQLARRNYFNGLTFHRVVPNFVVQGGDPDGNGSGGPGYAIRCEVNDLRFGRGFVGMALSGKDTGGSQWFVTHAPQPHLDGGYTVFGRVVEGMEVVDRILRGDRMRTVTIQER